MSILHRIPWLCSRAHVFLRNSKSNKSCLQHFKANRPITVRSIFSKSQPLPKGDHEEFVLIYQLKHMRWIAAVSRLKLTQTGLLMGLCAFSAYLVHTGDSEIGNFYAVSGMAGLAVFVLFLISHFSRRLIGLAWLDKSKKTVKIAYLTFWGKRCDRTFPLVSVSQVEASQNKRNVFLRVRVEGNKEFYYLVLYGCQIPKRESFGYVFGKAPLQAYKARNRRL